MNKSLNRLCALADKQERRWIGLLSGTSQDGVDIGCFRITGHGFETEVVQEHFETVAYSAELQDRLGSIAYHRNCNLQELTLLNGELGRFYAKAVKRSLENWNIRVDDVDAIASHGQTIYHAPRHQHGDLHRPNATLQLGDGDHLARLTGLPVIHDFRQKHIAAGGEGAPLAIYLDHLLFHREGQLCVMLNIGGIANFTWLDGSRDWKTLLSTDTGPGNTLLDAVVRRNQTGHCYDPDGRWASEGEVKGELLAALKSHPFFGRNPPKSTGPEDFSLSWLDEVLKQLGLENIKIENLLATLVQFTVDSIAQSIRQTTDTNGIEVLVSGGGVHNGYMMRRLQQALPGMTVQSLAQKGIDPDAKEALLFAVLGNEFVAGEGLPAPGGEGRIHLGKVSLPG